MIFKTVILLSKAEEPIFFGKLCFNFISSIVYLENNLTENKFHRITPEIKTKFRLSDHGLYPKFWKQSKKLRPVLIWSHLGSSPGLIGKTLRYKSL